MSQGLPLLQRIEACTDFTPAERRVAGFYEDGYPSVALLNLEEVRSAVGVSTASVARFARKLDYENFKDLSHAIQAEVRSALDRPTDRLRRGAYVGQRESVDHGLADRFAESAFFLRETARGVSPVAFESVVGLLCDESRPLVLGAVASGRPLLVHAGLLLSYLRADVTVLEGTDRWAHDLAGLSSNAVVVGAAFDRYPVPVQRLLRFARSRGATTVLITNQRSSPLVKDADLCLFARSDGDAPFRSRIGLVFLLEAIVDGVSRRTPASARPNDIEQVFALMGGYLADSRP